MYHIFVDLEFNNVDRKNRKQYGRNEVIQFGAVALDENLQEVGHFESYVKPQYSSCIHSIIKELTGITDKMVAGAEGFEVVLRRFCEWCQGFGEYAIYEWSDSDLMQILRECRCKGICLEETEKQVLRGWEDVQRLFDMQVATRDQVALESALWALGEGVEGKLHDALWDARNTARVFALMQDEANVERAKQMLHHGTPNTSFSCTLADLFDFSKLQLAVG